MACSVYLIGGFVVGLITCFVISAVKRMTVLRGIDEVNKDKEAEENKIKEAMNKVEKARKKDLKKKGSVLADTNEEGESNEGLDQEIDG